MAVPEDRDLIDSTRRGDLNAYGLLVERYQRSVFGVCYRLLGQRQDAEDAVQEVFLRGHRYLDGYDVERPFGPWVRRVAANYCLDLLQKKGGEALPLLDETDRPAASQTHRPGPEEAQIRREARRDVHQAIASLPDHYRTVIELRHFQELNYQEIADRLDLPLNTIKSHLLRARKLLMERLQDV